MKVSKYTSAHAYYLHLLILLCYYTHLFEEFGLIKLNLLIINLIQLYKNKSLRLIDFFLQMFRIYFDKRNHPYLYRKRNLKNPTQFMR